VTSRRTPQLPQLPRRGELWWAFVDFAPSSPFEIWDDDAEEFTSVEVDVLARQIRDGKTRTQLDMIVGVKLRPVLVLNEPRERIPEYLILTVARLGKFSPELAARVRRGDEPSLFHLAPGRYGQDQENAIDLHSLARVNETAFPTGRPAGKLDTNVMRVIDERLARTLDLDLDTLIKAEAARMLEEARELAEQADED
jgi:hypothetical protein